MPIYEYRCEECGQEFERIQRFSDPLVTICDLCGGPVKKLISNTSFVLKGSGWYLTDYARAGQEKKSPDTKSTSDGLDGKKNSTPENEAKSSGGDSSPPKASKSDGRKSAGDASSKIAS